MRHQKYNAVAELCRRFGMSTIDATQLRRCARVLSTWDEHECNGTIQRDEATQKPYWHSPNSGRRLGSTADRERGAEARAKTIAAKYGALVYRQGDPRGASLHAYTQADLDAYRARVQRPDADIDSCYSTIATAVC